MKTTREGRGPNVSVETKLGKLSRLKRRKSVIVGDPEDIVHMDWLHEWTELKNIEPAPRKPRNKK
jgi:hypothetical protein